MSSLSWDPSASSGGATLILAQGSLSGSGVPGEILSLSTGSSVDLMNNIPPPAAETNWGNSLTCPIDDTTPVSAVQMFQVARNGWYDVVIDHATVTMTSAPSFTMAMIDSFIQDTSGNAIVATDSVHLNPAVVNPAYPSLKLRGYLTKNIDYKFEIRLSTFLTFSVSLLPIPVAGATLAWDNVYIFPITSGIDGVGDSPFVILK